MRLPAVAAPGVSLPGVASSAGPAGRTQFAGATSPSRAPDAAEPALPPPGPTAAS